MKDKMKAEVTKTKEPNPSGFACKNLLIASVFLFVIGFVLGQYFETKDRTSVFVVNEARLLKIVSVGLALQDKDKKQKGLTLKDRQVVRSTMKNLSVYLNKYLKHPVLIEKNNNQGYELYRGVRKIDITQELIIKLIGKKKWDSIGEEFSLSS